VVIAAVVATLTALLLVPLALAHKASGGQSIASAPDLPLQASVSGGSSGNSEYWGVTLAAGDKLTIDYQGVNGGCVNLYLYEPGVTDSTINNTSSDVNRNTCSHDELSWTATVKGRWILRVNSDSGYQLTARVAAGRLAQASASETISGATELPRGHAFVDGQGYWLVTLAAGDKLTIDYQGVNGGCVNLYLYEPGVTDSTINNTSSDVNRNTCSKDELSWIVTGRGAWILKATSDSGYELTARVTAGKLTQASAAGTIAGAKQLPLGHAFVDGAGYWRVALAAGDKLKIDYEGVNGGCVNVYVYSPGVTDYTVGNASSVANDESCGTREFIWPAPRGGRWIVKITSDNGYRLKAQVIRKHPARVPPKHPKAPTIRAVSPHCTLSSLSARVGQTIHGHCVAAPAPAGTAISIVYRANGRFLTAVQGHVGSGSAWSFTLRGSRKATFDLWVSVAASSSTKAARSHIGELHIH
jgi:hypothetical protein